ncbi:glycosyltransferase [Arsenicicoccus piscis]|nr:glycosyltransferase [Arsenicicoccus piscis]MCH8629107.1 glycosyltransferase [Arsenicicoccus piscis]
MTGSPRVAAVLVTWNRRQLLAESIAALQAQTYPLAHLVVVDNASTDGTAEDLAVAEGIDVVTSSRNTGGAGGFAIGLQRALALGCDAVWLMDDDTVPTPTALAALVAARDEFSLGTPALVASKVVWTDGRDHPMNTPRANPFATQQEKDAAAAIGCIPVRTASFVSILVDAAVVQDRGLPVADYFLWNDDFEYSARLVKGGHGLYCPASVVVHKTKTFGSSDADPGKRFYYEVRNKGWVFGRSRSLSPKEKLVYGGSTLLRWGRTFAHSTDRSTLGRELLRGAKDALIAGPRSTEALIAEVTRPVDGDTPLEDPSARREDFSVLLSCYAKDDPGLLADAVRSVTDEQTRRPAQLVLVLDGPLPDALRTTVDELAAASSVPVTLVPLPANVGLGPALQAGLAACEHDIVARMDADDITLPQRFARQVPLLEQGCDLVSSAMLEMGADRHDIVGRRVPPLTPEQIRATSRFAQPFNHPTVVYRKTLVQAVGGYTDLANMEDYLLFAKMILAGAQVANVAEPLLLYRVGQGAYARRGGTGMLATEWRLQRAFREIGFTTAGQQARNLTVRGVYRLVPESLRKNAYRALLATRGERRADRRGERESG